MHSAQIAWNQLAKPVNCQFKWEHTFNLLCQWWQAKACFYYGVINDDRKWIELKWKVNQKKNRETSKIDIVNLIYEINSVRVCAIEYILIYMHMCKLHQRMNEWNEWIWIALTGQINSRTTNWIPHWRLDHDYFHKLRSATIILIL